MPIKAALGHPYEGNLQRPLSAQWLSEKLAEKGGCGMKTLYKARLSFAQNEGCSHIFLGSPASGTHFFSIAIIDHWSKVKQ